MTPVPVPASEHAGTHGRPAARMCPGKARVVGRSLSTLSMCVDMRVRVCVGVCTKLSIGMCVLGKCIFMYILITFLTGMTKYLAREA